MIVGKKNKPYPAKRTGIKKRAANFLRKTIISSLVLLVLLIVAGIVYTWIMGQTNVADTPADPVQTLTNPFRKPTAPSPDRKESASVQSLTSPVTPGSNASITVRTNAGSTCKIKVEYNKVPSTDSGLVEKTADDYGMVTWSWTVENSVPVGEWPVTVTCTFYEKSAVVVGDMKVAL